MPLTLRSTKGSALTHTEMDDNWTGLSNGSFWAATITATSNITLTGTLSVSSTLTAGATTATSLTVSTGNLTVSAGQILQQVGTAGAPGYSFSGSPTYGVSLRSDVAWDVNIAGVASLDVQFGSVTMRSGQILGWSGSDDASGSSDARLLRLTVNSIGSDSHFSPTVATTNTRDLGISGTNLWRTGYFGTSVVTPLLTASGVDLGLTTAWSIRASNAALAPLVSNDNLRDLGQSDASVRTGYFKTSISIIGTVSGTGVLAVGNGTRPTAQTDTVGFYSSDIAAGHTEPSFFCEGTQVLATGQADSASSVRVKMRINGTEVTLLAI